MTRRASPPVAFAHDVQSIPTELCPSTWARNHGSTRYAWIFRSVGKRARYVRSYNDPKTGKSVYVRGGAKRRLIPDPDPEARPKGGFKRKRGSGGKSCWWEEVYEKGAWVEREWGEATWRKAPHEGTYNV